MQEQRLIIKALKQELRARGITYCDIAKELNLSEASIKRLLQKGDLSLERLIHLCSLCHLDLADLTRIAKRQQQTIRTLSLQQEQTLVKDPDLLLVTICALNYWCLDDITRHYKLDKAQCLQQLIKLDELNIIQLRTNNRIKLMIASDFQWITNGPIEQFFKKHLEQDFFNAAFNQQDELFLCINGMLSDLDISELKKDIDKLKNKYANMNRSHENDNVDKLKGVALVLGMRPWLPKLFLHYTLKNTS